MSIFEDRYHVKSKGYAIDIAVDNYLFLQRKRMFHLQKKQESGTNLRSTVKKLQ